MLGLIVKPSCPDVLSHQHATPPVLSKAQLWWRPVVMVTAVGMLLFATTTGAFDDVLVPSPSSPSELVPQQRAPSAWTRIAQLWPKPAAIAVAPVRFATGLGKG